MEIKELLKKHDIDSVLELADELYQNQEYSQAIQTCEAILEYDEKNPYMLEEENVFDVKEILMRSCFIEGNQRKALKYADELICSKGNLYWLLISKSHIQNSLSDVSGAENTSAKAVDEAKNSFGSESTEYVEALSNYAGILGRSFDIHKAGILFEEAYEIASGIEMEPKQLGFLIRDIGRFYDVNENRNKALIKFEEAQKILQNVLEKDDIDMLGLINDIACSLMELNYLDRAIEKFEELLKICTDLFGKDSFNTLITKGNLARAYENNGDYEAAEEMLIQAIDGHFKLNGEESKDYQRELLNYAGLLNSMNRLDEAIRIHLKVYELRKKYRGEFDTDTLDAIRSVGDCYRFVNKYSDAIPYYRKALTDINVNNNYDFFDCLTLTEMAYCYASMKDNESAQEMIEIAANNLDELGEMTSVIRSRICSAESVIALNNMNYEEAVKKSRTALKLNLRNGGGENYHRVNHAHFLFECGKNEDAEQLYMECMYSVMPTKYNIPLRTEINCWLVVLNADKGDILSADKYSEQAEKYLDELKNDIDLFNFWYMKAFVAKHKNNDISFNEYLTNVQVYLENLHGDERSRDKLEKLLAE